MKIALVGSNSYIAEFLLKRLEKQTYMDYVVKIDKSLNADMYLDLQKAEKYADVRDAVRAYYMLVTENPIAGEYYNIGGSYTCEVGDTLNMLLSYSTKRDTIKVVIDQERLRPIDADLQVPDCRKFKEHTGWEPKISFEETMFDLLEYWRNKIKKGKVFLTR